MQSFSLQEGNLIMDRLILSIQDKKQYLSDMDGLIGDGDHGINMNKGFSLCREELDKNPGDLKHSMNILAKILMMKIGGSMGPLYGKFFKGIATAMDSMETIGINEFGEVMESALNEMKKISNAKPGDKTLMDTLVPAAYAYRESVNENIEFTEALDRMVQAGRHGFESTKDMVASVGRASRLGERSRGVTDPGAASCFIILESIAESIKLILKNKTGI